MTETFKFGEIVVNEWASERNPQRVLMVVSVGKFINCLSREGKKVRFYRDKDLRLTKVTRLCFDTWDAVIESKTVTDQRQP